MGIARENISSEEVAAPIASASSESKIPKPAKPSAEREQKKTWLEWFVGPPESQMLREKHAAAKKGLSGQYAEAIMAGWDQQLVDRKRRKMGLPVAASGASAWSERITGPSEERGDLIYPMNWSKFPTGWERNKAYDDCKKFHSSTNAKKWAERNAIKWKNRDDLQRS